VAERAEVRTTAMMVIVKETIVMAMDLMIRVID
jgi:hypothetical protein